MKLRPYQQNAVNKIKANLANGVNRQLIKHPTGMGKTVVFSTLPDSLGFSGRMLVLDHRQELTNQAVDKLRKWNPLRTVGVEMGIRRSAPSDQLVVAGVQTIGRKGSPRLLQFNPDDFDAIVVDEAQHSISPSYLTVLNHFRVFEDAKRLCVGFTATPNRSDGKGLGKIFQVIADDISILDGIKDGWLSNLKCWVVKSKTSLDDVHTKAGDFDLNELSTEIDTPARNDLVVRAWLENGQNRQTIVFCSDVQHSKNVADNFRRYGVAAEAIWGDDLHREEKLKAHQQGKLKVLVNCQILTEGYDDWRVGCIILARPTQSEGLFVQCIGRGTRIPDGINNLIEARKLGLEIAKEDCIIIDVVDISTKHSLVRMPTLFGMNQDMNLRGKTLTAVMEEVERIKANKPYIDITKVTDINQLSTYAEQVDLFKVEFAPEVVQLSEYQWHKNGENSYVLMLTGGESVHLHSDMLERWHMNGVVNGVRMEDVKPTFEETIREADFKVKLLGGKSLETLIKREMKWHHADPTPPQLELCRRLRIFVPPGATKGEVHQAITAELARRKQRRAA